MGSGIQSIAYYFHAVSKAITGRNISLNEIIHAFIFHVRAEYIFIISTLEKQASY